MWNKYNEQEVRKMGLYSALTSIVERQDGKHFIM